jgi:hypothetical protein
MALYVHPENQQLLWNIINTNPHLTGIFAKYHPAQKAQWFKSIIETFYKQYEKTELTKNDVHKLNKDTLEYMIQLTHKIPPVTLGGNASPIYEGGGAATPMPPRPMVIEKTDPSAAAAQAKYMPLNETRPEPIDFREAIADEPIQNMDDLLQKQIREIRELKQIVLGLVEAVKTK